MGSNQQARSAAPSPEIYYSVVFEVHGTRAYTDPFTFEGDAERKRDALATHDCVTDARVVGHQDSVGEAR